MPPSLANRPHLDQRWLWPYTAWQELSGSRVYNQTVPALIAFSEVAAYGFCYGLSRREVTDLWDDVHVLDKAWQTEVTKMAEDQAK